MAKSILCSIPGCVVDANSTGMSIVQETDTSNGRFFDIFDELISSILDGPKFAAWPIHRERIKRVIVHTSHGGAKTRGLMLVRAYETFANPEDITEESIKMAYVLGWSVELLQSGLLILDDIGDNSMTRRGNPCWYRMPGIGMSALNDAILMLTVLLDILMENFGSQPWYAKLLDIFNEATRHMCMGQFSMLFKDFNQFTMENYECYSNYKLAYYTFKMPVLIAWLLAKKEYHNVFQNIEELLKDMGVLIAIQNDYADCYIDESISGKVGNDIEEGQFTWLAVKALELCNQEQRNELEKCYGSADPDCVKRVKNLYLSLGIPQLCRQTIQNLYADIASRINKLPQDNLIPPPLLLKLMDMIYYMKIE